MVAFIIVIVALLFAIEAMEKKPEVILLAHLDTRIGNAGFLDGDIIDSRLLMQFANTDYELLKDDLGLNGEDFALMLQEQNGQIIPIDGKLCIGSGRAKVNGQRCS